MYVTSKLYVKLNNDYSNHSKLLQNIICQSNTLWKQVNSSYNIKDYKILLFK